MAANSVAFALRVFTTSTSAQLKTIQIGTVPIVPASAFAVGASDKTN